MMTAQAIPSPADVFPAMKACIVDHRVHIDYRTRDCVPFLHGGCYHDSFEAAMQHERYRLGGIGVPTKEEVAAKQEEERLRRVESHQPWDADAP